ACELHGPLSVAITPGDEAAAAGDLRAVTRPSRSRRQQVVTGATWADCGIGPVRRIGVRQMSSERRSKRGTAPHPTKVAAFRSGMKWLAAAAVGGLVSL